MKKHLTSLLTVALVLSGLTGCSENTSSPSENSPNTPAQTESSVNSSTSSTESSSTSSSDTDLPIKNKYAEVFGDSVFDSVVDITPQNEWLKNDFMENAKELGVTLLNPDGTEFNPSEAVRAGGNKEQVGTLFFDYAYILYSKPYFYTALDTPDLDSYEKMQSYESRTPLHEKSEFIKVKAGDVLDNGLKVKRAVYGQDLNMGELDYANSMRVEFEGELTLDGVMIYCPPNEEYPDGFYCFFPDANKEALPKISRNVQSYSDADNKVFVVSDTPKITFRNSASPETASALKGLFNGNYCVKATATMKDPIYNYALGPDFGCTVSLTSVEKLDS